jgi:hypothetical protein
MGIYRSTNPTDFNAIDGIVVDETSPPPSVSGVGTGTAILVGQFERGPVATPTIVDGPGELQEKFGKSDTYSGNVALKNKKFAELVVVRAAAAAAAVATHTFQSAGAVNIIKFDALYPGAYGNGIQVTVDAGSTAGSKYTIHDASANPVLADEVYDNVVITAVGSTFSASKLCKVTVLATSAEPAAAAATNLASGTDGVIADTDYQTAITSTEVEGIGDILFLDAYNQTRNGYLKTTAANTQDKDVILSGSLSDLYTDAITNVGSMRDNDGRLIYAFNPVQTVIGGVPTYTDPASWVATILSQTSPAVDPAYAGNTQYLAGATGLKYTLSRAAYIALKNAGICAFEYDADIGFKIKSGVCTQIADTSKLTIARRRMADYLTKSAGRFLKAYQNAVNSLENRNAVKAAILNFIQTNENLGLLPKDKEVKNGKAKLVDTDSLNTDTTVGQGYFFVLWKQRIYSSMRFIVLQAQIGETVVVTEQ